MINRLYVHNYRCLENFEMLLGGLPSSLLIGRNGAGKSTVREVLRILQSIGRKGNRVRDLVRPRDIGRRNHDEPVRIELEAILNDKVYAYVLAFELPEGFRELRVLEESLTVDGIPKFTREVAEMKFPRKDGVGEGVMRVDWHLVGLPLVQARSEIDPVHIFMQWLSRMVILAPVPSRIDGASEGETLEPHYEGTNLGAWWAGLLAHSPAAYADIDQTLRRMMPDLKDIKNPIIAEDARSLLLHFGSQSSLLPLSFNALSDGEKCMFIWALVVAANKAYGPLFCFWDELDSHLAMSEVGDATTEIRQAFRAGGQFVAVSHNAETIRQFTPDNIFLLDRRGHLEPTIIRKLQDMPPTDLIGAMRRGELHA